MPTTSLMRRRLSARSGGRWVHWTSNGRVAMGCQLSAVSLLSHAHRLRVPEQALRLGERDDMRRVLLQPLPRVCDHADALHEIVDPQGRNISGGSRGGQYVRRAGEVVADRLWRCASVGQPGARPGAAGRERPGPAAAPPGGPPPAVPATWRFASVTKRFPGPTILSTRGIVAVP